MSRNDECCCTDAHAPILLRPPLSSEWEELVDHETQHRFFANMITKETSWTDPRDSVCHWAIVVAVDDDDDDVDDVDDVNHLDDLDDDDHFAEIITIMMIIILVAGADHLDCEGSHGSGYRTDRCQGAVFDLIRTKPHSLLHRNSRTAPTRSLSARLCRHWCRDHPPRWMGA